MNCYNCSSKATHAVHLGEWKEVCKFHHDEVLEEETDGVWVRTIDNHSEVLKRGESKNYPTAS